MLDSACVSSLTELEAEIIEAIAKHSPFPPDEIHKSYLSYHYSIDTLLRAVELSARLGMSQIIPYDKMIMQDTISRLEIGLIK